MLIGNTSLGEVGYIDREVTLLTSTTKGHYFVSEDKSKVDSTIGYFGVGACVVVPFDELGFYLGGIRGEEDIDLRQAIATLIQADQSNEAFEVGQVFW